MSNDDLLVLSEQVMESLSKEFEHDEKLIDGVELLFNKVGNQFFLAPLNALESGQYCFNGGLAKFSYNWYKRCIDIRSNNPFEFGNVETKSIALLCFLGQISKAAIIVNDAAYPVYKDGSELRGYKYSFTNEYFKFQITKSFGLNTLFLLQKFEIVLNDEEYNSFIGLCNLIFGDYYLSNQTNNYRKTRLELLLELGYGLTINEQGVI